MTVSSDDNIHTPVGIQRGRELLVLLQTDVRKQNGHVDIRGSVRVANFANLAQCVLKVDQHAGKPIRFGVCHHIPRQDTDKEYAHAINFFDPMRAEHSFPNKLNIHVGADDGKTRALFQKQKVRKTVIHLMVPQ